MTIPVRAPLAGALIGMEDVPDPVFAQEIIGPGFAIRIPEDATLIDALAPVDGTVTSLHPHAFVVEYPGGPPVLVHLGIDTVVLKGRGFQKLVEVGEPVRAGDPLITWDASFAREAGLSTVVPVVVLAPGTAVVPLVRIGEGVEASTLIARI